MLMKLLLCQFGRHKWTRQQTEDRRTFYCCERCQETQDKWFSSVAPPGIGS